jgi:hypothetical protein
MNELIGYVNEEQHESPPFKPPFSIHLVVSPSHYSDFWQFDHTITFDNAKQMMHLHYELREDYTHPIVEVAIERAILELMRAIRKGIPGQQCRVCGQKIPKETYAKI